MSSKQDKTEKAWITKLKKGEPAYRAKYGVKYKAQEKAKSEAGRYTLKEAADFIGGQANEREEAILKKLVKAAESKTLATYAPGSRVKYESNEVRDYYEEVYWSDLNEWLENNEPLLVCKFPNPNTPPAVGQAAPDAAKDANRKANNELEQSKQDALAVEIDAILSASPTLLPSQVKAKLRDRIGISNSQIVGNTSGGLQWEHDDGETVETTYANIDKRIGRWKLKHKKYRITPALPPHNRQAPSKK